jgi:glycosyltransferase involved in cell wall biosynthesis
MRVTFVLPEANLGGGTRVIAQHAENLRRRGHSVYFISTPPWGLSFRHKLSVYRRIREWPRFPKKVPSHLDGLGFNHRVLKRRRPVTDRDVPDADITVATWWETVQGVMNLSPRKGASAYFIQGTHFGPFFDDPGDRVAATWRAPIQKIVCSQWLADLARDQFDDDSVLVARNGLDLRLFDAPERGRQAQPTVGMAYADVPCKGIETGLKAFERAAERIPGLRLRLFGMYRPLRPLPPNSDFVQQPPQSQIRAIYSECDVWLCTSRNEGFCLPPLEAMGCRCPAVCTRVGGLTEILRDGVNGFLVDIDDIDALADRLVQVLSLPESAWKPMSNAAYAAARSYTSIDAADAFEQALHTTIERSKNRRSATFASA